MTNGSLRSHVFVDRAAAGVELARLIRQKPLSRPLVVLGLPRGGVPVAFEVARALNAPLDVMPVRKVAMPEQPEVAIGAVAPYGVTVSDLQALQVMPRMAAEFDALAAAQRVELGRREQVYRAGLEPLELAGKTVVLVDDGLATGYTMLAAVRAAREAAARTVVVAAPVASPEAVELVARESDAVIVLEEPNLMAIGAWYRHFEQLEDVEVCRLLALARQRHRQFNIADQAS